MPTFRPYPAPQEEPDQFAQGTEQLSRMMQLYANYSLQREQMDQTKEQARQQRVLDLIRLKGEYGEDALTAAQGAGVQVPGITPGAAVPAAVPPAAMAPPMPGPTAGMMDPTGAPALTAPGPMPGAAPSAPQGPMKATDITPEYLSNMRKTKGTKGSERFMKETEFTTNQRKAANEIDQNTPLTAEQVQAGLAPFGDIGAQTAARLIQSSPNGIPRQLFTNTQTTLAGMNRTQSANMKPPEGYTWGPNNSLVAIPGGPVATKLDEQKTKEAGAKAAALGAADVVIGKVDQALQNVNGWTTGFGAKVFGNIPGSQAKSLENDVKTIQANLGFEQLAEMRKNSPTGGALGAIAVRELDLLQSTLASLDTTQAPAQLQRNLMEVRDHYSKWKDAVQGGGVGQQNGGAPTQAAAHQMPTVTSQQQYASLPSGTTYMDAGGTMRRKK